MKFMSWHYIKNVISDLNPNVYTSIFSMAKLKNNTEILVIDDHEFNYLESLKTREFRIRRKEDITDLNDVEVYDIVLCDIRGVGKIMNSKYEGADLIKELKTKYPYKYIIAYTANEYNASFEPFLERADKIIEKGSLDLDDWVSLLEQAVLEQANPVSVWNKKRKALIDVNVSTIEIAELESKYVDAIKNKNYESFEKLCDTKTSDGADILKDLTTSVIAKIIKP